VSKLQAYDLNIEYMKGNKNIIIDELSRTPSFHSFSVIIVDWKEKILV